MKFVFPILLQEYVKTILIFTGVYEKIPNSFAGVCEIFQDIFVPKSWAGLCEIFQDIFVPKSCAGVFFAGVCEI